MKMVPMTLLCNSMSAIYLAKNPIYHKITKHIDVQYHFIREKVEGEVALSKIATADQLADALTKPLDKIKFIQHVSKMLGF